MSTVNPKLTLDDLAAGLLSFSDTYLALDVFAQDVGELESESTMAAAGLVPRADGSLDFERRGKRFNMRLFQDLGVVRVTGAGQPPAPVPAPAVTGAAGAAIGAAVAKRGEGMGGAAVGLLLGLLVGAALGEPSRNAPRRVFALRFDPDTREWRAYDGGLVRWMKEQLGPPEVVEGLPPRAQGA